MKKLKNIRKLIALSLIVFLAVGCQPTPKVKPEAQNHQTDWTAGSGDRWVVPLGAGGGKLVMLGGKLPLNLQTQLYYNVVRPDFGPEWQWRVQVQLLLPKTIFKSKK